MQLLELKIRNIRGIRRLDLAPQGRTIGIVGGNGTGKSAVLDSIDFLLTGEIERVKGRQGASLRQHGRHIQARVEECSVEAVVRLPGTVDSVRLTRGLSAPSVLTVEPETRRAEVGQFIEAAQQRQYILTRADILQFICSRASERAEMVQRLLKLERVEELRQVLGRAANTERSRFDQLRSARVQAEGVLTTTLSLNRWDEPSTLSTVNRLREVLAGAAVTTLDDIRRDLVPPMLTPLPEPAPTLIGPPNTNALIRSVGMALTVEPLASLDRADTTLRGSINELTASPGAVRAARQVELVALGVRSLEGDAACPLCDLPWDSQQLADHLNQKLDRGNQAAPIWMRMRQAADTIHRWIGNQLAALDAIIAAGQTPGRTDPAGLVPYRDELTRLIAALSDPLSRYLPYRNNDGMLSLQLGAEQARDTLRVLFRETATEARQSPAQAAWDTLTRAEENWAALKLARSAENEGRGSAQRTELLRSTFVESRDAVLTNLYESVKDRFVALYRQLHQPEEQGFNATLCPEQAGVGLTVDFHGTGMVAPFALHSEGHQDSMGLCLFLALAERAQGTRLGLCMLDDIVMSVDVGHRSNVAALLATLKHQTQFIITTHDLVWAKQLQTMGCVATRDFTRFFGWSLEGGSLVNEYADFLAEARAELTRANVRAAAAALRHGLEMFLHFAADALEAPVPYSLANQYDYGQLYNASTGRQGELLGKAKAAARSWNRDLTALIAFEARRSAALSHLSVQQWSVNPNVHFNQWMDMIPAEFAPVVEAFAEVCKLFTCARCEGLATVVREGATPISVRCTCGEFDWGLRTR